MLSLRRNDWGTSKMPRAKQADGGKDARVIKTLFPKATVDPSAESTVVGKPHRHQVELVFRN